TVIADDGAGGRATNTFNATTAAHTNSNNNAFLLSNTVTNLAAPANHTLTNFIQAVELDNDPLYWFPVYAEQQSANAITNFSITPSNGILRTLTYNVTNQSGQLQFFLTPTNNFAGQVKVYFDVSYNPNWSFFEQLGLALPPYDEQVFTFVFGDTPVAGQSNAVTVLAGATFTNALLATFTNGVPGSAATNFTASINWGDNTITSGSVATNGGGQKVVLGTHAYPYPGSYPVYVKVQSSIGASVTILSYVTAITVPKLSLGASPAPSANGFSFNLQVTSGLNVSIQFSGDLKNWTTLTNFTATNSTLAFRDPAATNSSRRFYRAVVP